MMEEEVEDLVGEVKYTNSSKSITNSILCSCNFSDCSPDRNHSSEKNTYVLGYDDTDSESTERTYELQHNLEYTNMLLTNGSSGYFNLTPEKLYLINKHIHKPLLPQEIFTQTSKTIIELAVNEGVLHNKKETGNLETQTSCISFCANNFLKYNTKIDEVSHKTEFKKAIDILDGTDEVDSKQDSINIDNLKEDSTNIESNSLISNQTSNDSLNRENLVILENNSQNKQEEDDIEHLYNKVLENIHSSNDYSEDENVKRQFATLSPVTEESTNKSIIDITPNEVVVGYEFLVSNSMNKTKCCWPEELNKINETKPLPKNITLCPNTPLSHVLYSTNRHDKIFSKLGNLFNSQGTHKTVEFGSNLASGENINGAKRQSLDIYLPPIHNNNSKKPAPNSQIDKMLRDSKNSSAWHIEPICIEEKIQELKHADTESPPTNDTTTSPKSSLPDHEINERSCEALCAEILRRLKSNSWTEVVETLEWIPKSLEKFWDVIAEIRISDLIRQVTTSIESPRTQVSKAACTTLTFILQKTNYVKKPEFYEAISSILNKTGSYSRPLRRIANISLDRIVCKVDTTHAVTAICMYGTSHKSGLVRSAAARLLVVASALAGGGRHLLKSRPSTVATARQHLLKSLALLLEDKNRETRKFAERLYSILRPLKNFEAYYLNDVTIEVASRQMKKFDQTLLNEDVNLR